MTNVLKLLDINVYINTPQPQPGRSEIALLTDRDGTRDVTLNGRRFIKYKKYFI